MDLDRVRVEATDRIGPAGTGWATWSTVMADAIVLVAAQAVGAAEATHALTTEYAKERHDRCELFQHCSTPLVPDTNSTDWLYTLRLWSGKSKAQRMPVDEASAPFARGGVG